MRERCWFIPEQVLKGKLPYRDFETFYGPPNPFLLAVVYYIGGSRDRSTAGTGKLIRLSCSAIQRQPSYPFAAVEKPTLILRTSDRVLDQPGGGMASNTG